MCRPQGTRATRDRHAHSPSTQHPVLGRSIYMVVKANKGQLPFARLLDTARQCLPPHAGGTQVFGCVCLTPPSAPVAGSEAQGAAGMAGPEPMDAEGPGSAFQGGTWGTVRDFYNQLFLPCVEGEPEDAGGLGPWLCANPT